MFKWTKTNYKFLAFFIMLLFMFSCDRMTKEQREASKINVDLEVLRMDRVFYESSPKDLPQLREEYATFFPKSIHDSVFINKLNNPVYIELYQEVQKKFNDNKELIDNVIPTLQLIKYYFPKVKLPHTMVTLISDMDYEKKVIFTDSLLIVSVDLYLGKEHPFYDDFYDYQRQNFRKEMILPDLVSDFATYVVEPNRDRTLLSQMIFEGKELYLKDVLLPNTLDSDKIGFTKEHLKWCEVNEENIWRYFMDENLLFDTSFHTYQRFLEPGPFSKFYMEFDNETPARVGAWVGWQIVKKFMKSKNYSLEEMLDMDPKLIFELSKYKP